MQNPPPLPHLPLNPLQSASSQHRKHRPFGCVYSAAEVQDSAPAVFLLVESDMLRHDTMIK